MHLGGLGSTRLGFVGIGPTKMSPGLLGQSRLKPHPPPENPVPSRTPDLGAPVMAFKGHGHGQLRELSVLTPKLSISSESLADSHQISTR